MRLRALIISFLFSFSIVHPAGKVFRDIAVHIANRPTVTISAFDTLGITYCSLNELTSALSFASAVNDTVGKLEFRTGSHRVKATTDSPFLVITDLNSNTASVFQLPVPVRVVQKRFFVPLPMFSMFLDNLWDGTISYNDASRDLVFASTSPASLFDITGIEIESRLNGYLVTVMATRKLGEMEAWLKPDGWLFLTVANANADTVAISQVKPMGAIRQILTFQSPTSVQLTFKVAPDVIQAEVAADHGSNNLLLSLRTRSETERIELEKRRQALIREKLEEQRSRAKLDVIVIDAGHGGKDPGTIGVGGTKEKDVTLAVALELGKLIEKTMKDVKVVYTRKDDTFIELYRRTQIANEAGGKLFVSIHCNSTERKPSSQNGFEIYLLRPGRTAEAVAIAERENAVVKLEEGYEQRYKELTEENFILVTMAQSAFMKYSERFAEVAAESMAKSLKIKNSGVKQAGFYVLVGASMPNVLVETGYLSNRAEEKVLRSKQGQKKIAEALFEGIKDYKKIYEQALHDGKASGAQ
jgi:N-acetylmuramoyl-L-alanine amidase